MGQKERAQNIAQETEARTRRRICHITATFHGTELRPMASLCARETRNCGLTVCSGEKDTSAGGLCPRLGPQRPVNWIENSYGGVSLGEIFLPS